MTENHNTGHDDQKRNSAEDKNEKNSSETDSTIIELSDIAIGITPEDDAIVELTEEIIGEAFVGFSGATSDVFHKDERVLDLSENLSGTDISPDQTEPDRMSESHEPDDLSGGRDIEEDNLEDDISRELDNYFGTDDDKPITEETTLIAPQSPPVEDKVRPSADDEAQKLDEVRISSGQLDDAIERVIRKMFAEKINRILDDVIERTVSDEISQLKDYLLGVSGKHK